MHIRSPIPSDRYIWQSSKYVIMYTAGPNYIKLMIEFEGCVLHPYLDSTSLPTIGIGTIRYENGTSVTMSDPPITYDRAVELLMFGTNYNLGIINVVVKSSLNQNQVDSILSFSYNEGVPAFKSSTLLREINLNPNNPHIRNDFMMWVYDREHGVMVKNMGLYRRRQAEADLYFTSIS